MINSFFYSCISNVLSNRVSNFQLVSLAEYSIIVCVRFKLDYLSLLRFNCNYFSFHATKFASKVYGYSIIKIVEVVTTSTKTPHLVFLVFSSAEAIDSI